MLKKISTILKKDFSFKLHVKVKADQAFIVIVPEATQKEISFEL